MDAFTKLRDLNLGGNQITTIGRSLERFTDLEILNLSGNKIALFKVGIQSYSQHQERIKTGS